MNLASDFLSLQHHHSLHSHTLQQRSEEGRCWIVFLIHFLNVQTDLLTGRLLLWPTKWAASKPNSWRICTDTGLHTKQIKWSNAQIHMVCDCYSDNLQHLHKRLAWRLSGGIAQSHLHNSFVRQLKAANHLIMSWQASFKLVNKI